MLFHETIFSSDFFQRIFLSSLLLMIRWFLCMFW